LNILARTARDFKFRAGFPALSFFNPGAFLMINYNDFTFPRDLKPSVKQTFTLSVEQLAFLCLLAEKFNLTDDELKLVEYLVYRECKAISLN
jgi:hypothetical protein